MALEYRLLHEAEFVRLKDAYVQHAPAGTDIPKTAVVAGAFDGERLVGFLVLQPALHMEPAWADSAYSGQVRWPRMVAMLESGLPRGCDVYAFAPSRRVARLIEYCGYRAKEWKLWTRKVGDLCRS